MPSLWTAIATARAESNGSFDDFSFTNSSFGRAEVSKLRQRKCRRSGYITRDSTNTYRPEETSTSDVPNLGMGCKGLPEQRFQELSCALSLCHQILLLYDALYFKRCGTDHGVGLICLTVEKLPCATVKWPFDPQRRHIAYPVPPSSTLVTRWPTRSPAIGT